MKGRGQKNKIKQKPHKTHKKHRQLTHSTNNAKLRLKVCSAAPCGSSSGLRIHPVFRQAVISTFDARTASGAGGCRVNTACSTVVAHGASTSRSGNASLGIAGAGTATPSAGAVNSREYSANRPDGDVTNGGW